MVRLAALETQAIVACGVCDGRVAKPTLSGLKRRAPAVVLQTSRRSSFGWNRQIADFGRLCTPSVLHLFENICPENKA